MGAHFEKSAICRAAREFWYPHVAVPIRGCVRRFDRQSAAGTICSDHELSACVNLRLEIGDRITIVGREGIVRSIIPIRGQNQQRLVIQLLPNGDDF